MDMEHKKIKILQVIHGLHIGGAERVVVHLALSLKARGHDVGVCVVNSPGILAAQLEEAHVPVFFPRRKGSLIELGKTISRFAPEIIHSHGTSALMHLGPHYLRPQKPKFVHTFHYGNYPHIKWRYLLAESVFARRAARLIAVSDYQRETIKRSHKFADSRIVTIWNGVDRNHYLEDQTARVAVKSEFKISDGKTVIGAIAVLSRQKGIRNLIEAVAPIMERTPNVHFLIVGGGPLEPELRQLAVSLGVQDHVTFTGWRSDAEKIFAAIDVFVAPSLWEAFSVVLLEAMAARKAIVATRVGDNERLLENYETGLIVAPERTDELADAISTLAGNGNLREKLAARAYARFMQQFTVDVMVAKHEELYGSVLAG